MITEKKLVKKCLGCNARYQRHLYDRYAPKMYPICYRYAKNEEDAKDILQETFIKVFSKLADFKNTGSLEGWIRKITVNSAIRHYQKSVKKIDNGDIESVPEKYVDEDILDNINAREIIQVISHLPNGYRIVFNMYTIEGFSHKEIGDILHISESASRSQLTRARKLLINMLEKLKLEQYER